MSTQITIKDIAKMLGISVSTVSRALKDHPDINPETKRQVKELSDKLNYSPNAIALSLRNRKTFQLGIIVPEIVHHFFSCVISGIEQVANEHGYNVIIMQSNESQEREISICKSLMNARIDGVLASVSKTTTDTSHFKQLLKAGVPMVFFDRIAGDLDTDRVIVDDFQAAYNAVKYMISTGCKSIAHLSAPQVLQIGQKRQLGYKQALIDSNIEVDPSLIIACDNQFDAMLVGKQLMERDDRPDGIFAVNDLTAAGALYAVKKAGLKVPEDVSICGFTDGLVSTITDPPLTTISQHGEQMGHIAAQLLLKRISSEDSNYPTVTEVINTELIVRGSTKSISI
ncbi:MAG: LacI family transcriptional regulator [Culturomica sp.]|jgi:LacI family transcriptional regulator|nr:LacI family transcriptional regulator [Culturomica sp.]